MDGIKGIYGNAALPAGQTVKRTDKGDFLNTLKGFVERVDEDIQGADRKAEEFAVGKRYDLHEIMVSTEQADLSFKLLLQMRNKLLEAYQEIMRMQM